MLVTAHLLLRIEAVQLQVARVDDIPSVDLHKKMT